MVEPFITTGAATASALGSAAATTGKAIAAVGGALETANKVKREVGSIWKIDEENISFNCPTGVVKYSIAAHVKSGFMAHLLPSRLRFNDPRIRDVEVWSSPAFREERNAVAKAEVGYEIHPEKLSKGTEVVRITVSYDVDRRNFLRALVEWEHARDGREVNDEDHYWMTAQLKTLRALQTEYGRIDLRDAEFSVDVALQHVVKTAVPKKFTRHLEIQAALVRETDREKAGQLLRQNISLLHGDTTEKPDDILARVQDLFLAPNFRQFVTVSDDFVYAGAQRKESIQKVNPVADFPGQMSVISRTNLSLEKPCANGTLVYQRDAFRKKLEALFPRSMRDAP